MLHDSETLVVPDTDTGGDGSGNGGGVISMLISLTHKSKPEGTFAYCLIVTIISWITRISLMFSI